MQYRFPAKSECRINLPSRHPARSASRIFPLRTPLSGALCSQFQRLLRRRAVPQRTVSCRFCFASGPRFPAPPPPPHHLFECCCGSRLHDNDTRDSLDESSQNIGCHSQSVIRPLREDGQGRSSDSSSERHLPGHPTSGATSSGFLDSQQRDCRRFALRSLLIRRTLRPHTEPSRCKSRKKFLSLRPLILNSSK